MQPSLRYTRQWSLWLSLLAFQGCGSASTDDAGSTCAESKNAVGSWKTFSDPGLKRGVFRSDGTEVVAIDSTFVGDALCRVYHFAEPETGQASEELPPECLELAPRENLGYPAYAVSEEFLFFPGSTLQDDAGFLLERGTGVWSKVVRPPDYGDRVGVEVLRMGGEFLVWGGTFAPESAEAFGYAFGEPILDGYLFNPTTMSWVSYAAIPASVGPFFVERLLAREGEDDLIAFGYGERTTRAKPVNRLFLHSRASDSWREVDLEDGPPGRLSGKLSVVGEALFVGGGFVDPGGGRVHEKFHDLWSVNLSSQKWTRHKIPTWTSVLSHAALGERLFVWGECRNAALFDPESGRWEQATAEGSLAESGLVFQRAVEVGGKLVVGPGITHLPTATFALFDPRTE